MRWRSLCWFSPHRAQRRRAPSVDIALLLEVEDLVVTLSTPFILMGGESSPFSSSTSKDSGPLSGIANSLVPWRKQDEGFSVE